MYIIHGIPNCNTVKKALDWLRLHQIEFLFHDYKKKGIDRETLHSWCRQTSFEQLINKKGTTWKQLDATTQASIVNENNAISLMLDKNSVIKRPIITLNGQIVAIGFDEAVYAAVFDTLK